MTLTSVLPRLLLLLIVCPVFAGAADGNTEIGGHTKLRVVGQTYPSDSLLHDLFGSTSVDTQGDLRLNLEHRQSGWTFNTNYQLAALNGERVLLPDDSRRLFDLTSVIDQGSESVKRS